jgi:hypothetical protein
MAFRADDEPPLSSSNDTVPGPESDYFHDLSQQRVLFYRRKWQRMTSQVIDVEAWSFRYRQRPTEISEVPGIFSFRRILSPSLAFLWPAFSFEETYC